MKIKLLSKFGIPPRAERERGQAIVIIALAMVGLIAIAALVFDGGTAFSQRRKMQNAADAGAFAGARQLALGASDSTICAAVTEYTVTRNGAASFTATYTRSGTALGNVCGGSIPSGATGIRVVANTSFSTSFAGMLGQQTGSVGANATATFGGANNLVNNVMPIAPQCAVSNPTSMSQCGFNFNTSYDIWDGGGPGNFGWLAWDNDNASGSNQSAATLCANLQHPEAMEYENPDNSSDHSLSIGDDAQGSSGISGSTCVRNQLQSFITNATPITVILWDTTSGSGSNVEYHIVGFAEFVLEGFVLTGGGGQSYGNTSECASGGGNGNCIQGRFINYTIAAPISTTVNMGLTGVALTR